MQNWLASFDSLPHVQDPRSTPSSAANLGQTWHISPLTWAIWAHPKCSLPFLLGVADRKCPFTLDSQHSQSLTVKFFSELFSEIISVKPDMRGSRAGDASHASHARICGRGYAVPSGRLRSSAKQPGAQMPRKIPACADPLQNRGCAATQRTRACASAARLPNAVLRCCHAATSDARGERSHGRHVVDTQLQVPWQLCEAPDARRKCADICWT